MKRDRLGRGLGALLGEYLGEEGVPQQGGETGPRVQAKSLPIASIVPNPYQPRREFSEQDLADLTASLRENGLLQPIVVRPAPDGDGKWELVAGERRWRASLRLGWKEIPAVIKDVDDRTLLVLALVENLQRAQLSPLEEAEGYQRLAEEFSLTQQQVAEVVGKERSTVANSLRLLQLPSSVRQLLREGALSAGHARALLGLENDHRMAELARQATEEGWSVRDVEARVKRSRKPGRKAQGAAAARDAGERELEETLQRLFGTDVKIRAGRGGKGRVEIPFYSHEDFERIFETLSGQSASDVVS
ncbi:MAG TPA: ParB/RepB/Spo0J family partition protein [Longimicrobiales bacterium]|nr:ParB/RepB/Spo0J family partition protein [Longimicrobiales bacterium]